MKKPLLSEMTLREKIGQCLIVHQYYIHRKTDVDAKILRTSAERAEVLEREQLGVLYAQHGHMTQEHEVNLNDRLSKKDRSAEYGAWIEEEDACLKWHALVVSDFEREGAGHEFEDLSITCGPLAIGAADSEELAFELGAGIARELRCAGVNWRWAPVVDIGSRFTCSILRTYAPDDPERLVRIANAHIRGMQSEGVAGTAKHFPGHDRYEYRDGHFTTTKISSTMEEWWAEQGKVFQEVINGGVYSVMVGHTAFPAADDTIINDRYIPATVSKKIITDLLKGEMGFKGVVVTDGITMGGLYTMFSYEDLLVELMKAGNDVLLGCELRAGEILEKAVLDGRLSEERINDACQRVLDMKEKLGLFEDGYRLCDHKSEVEVPKTKAVNMEIARRGITLVRDRKSLLPLDSTQIKNVTIICSCHVDFFFEELENMKKEFEKRGAKVRLQRRLKNNEELEEISRNSDLIIYAVYIASHQPMGMPSLYGEECKTYMHALTSGKEKSIGVSMGYPYVHYDIMENADTFINTYGSSPELMKAFVEGIYGEIPIVGKSPVKLEPSRRSW